LAFECTVTQNSRHCLCICVLKYIVCCGQGYCGIGLLLYLIHRFLIKTAHARQFKCQLSRPCVPCFLSCIRALFILELPPEWTRMDGESWKRIALEKFTREYCSVVEHFRRSGPAFFRILSVSDLKLITRGQFDRLCWKYPMHIHLQRSWITAIALFIASAENCEWLNVLEKLTNEASFCLVTGREGSEPILVSTIHDQEERRGTTLHVTTTSGAWTVSRNVRGGREENMCSRVWQRICWQKRLEYYH